MQNIKVRGIIKNGGKVFLKLRVKVVEKWRKDEKVVKKQIAEN